MESDANSPSHLCYLGGNFDGIFQPRASFRPSPQLIQCRELRVSVFALQVLGGLASNELLKAVSGKGVPLNNCLFYALGDEDARVEQLG